MDKSTIIIFCTVIGTIIGVITLVIYYNEHRRKLREEKQGKDEKKTQQVREISKKFNDIIDKLKSMYNQLNTPELKKTPLAMMGDPQINEIEQIKSMMRELHQPYRDNCLSKLNIIKIERDKTVNRHEISNDINIVIDYVEKQKHNALNDLIGKG